jgi:kynureninase
VKIIYLDGNSLGPPQGDVVARLTRFVEDEWSGELIRAWNSRGWWDSPVTVGERIAPLLGAAPGQVIAGESTTVWLYKLLTAAMRLRPGRTQILTEAGQFPTDRHVIDAVAAQLGATVLAVAAGEIAAQIGESTAVVSMCHVDYRTGRLHDMATITAAAHAAGALTLWDLSHSVGAIDMHLDACAVDFAVGCTYKYLNGGPGSPAFAYVAERFVDRIEQPISGWIGHADPFSMDEQYLPANNLRRLLSGTSPVIALTVLDQAIDAFAGIDMAALRAHGVALTERFISRVDERLTDHGFEVASPRSGAERGSHVSLAHSDAYAIVQAAIAAGVIGDFRQPNLCRFGFAPLYITMDDVDEAVNRIERVMVEETYRLPDYQVRHTVT